MLVQVASDLHIEYLNDTQINEMPQNIADYLS